MTIEHRIVWTDEKVGRLWDYYSRTPPYNTEYFARTHGRAILAASRLAFDAPLNVLDFGSGPGFMCEHVREASPLWRYTALDFSQRSIDELRRRVPAGSAQFAGALVARTVPTELASEAFDVVLLIEVIEHLNDDYLAATLGEAKRLLKPGGKLVITTPNDERLQDLEKFCPDCGAIFHEWQHVRSWNVSSLGSCVAQFGFTTDLLEPRNFGSARITRRLINWARAIYTGDHKLPHLIGVFAKN